VGELKVFFFISISLAGFKGIGIFDALAGLLQ